MGEAARNTGAQRYDARVGVSGGKGMRKRRWRPSRDVRATQAFNLMGQQKGWIKVEGDFYPDWESWGVSWSGPMWIGPDIVKGPLSASGPTWNHDGTLTHAVGEVSP